MACSRDNSVAQFDEVISDSDLSEIRASSLREHVHLDQRTSSRSELDDMPSEILYHQRTVSRDDSGPMECPTPDLQSLQGAYLSNVERLEQSAERLSVSSDIGEEIRKIREEQKKSDSRRSSMHKSHGEEGPDSPKNDGSPNLRRQFSYGYGSHASNSIVGTNSVARSGGFSSAAYVASPRSSIRSGSWSHQNSIKARSTSQGPRLTQVTEPEQEGKPLDSPMSIRLASVPPSSGQLNGPLSLADHGPYNLDDIAIPIETVDQEQDENKDDGSEYLAGPRPSTDTTRQASGLFSDFDGVHTNAQPPESPALEVPLEVPLEATLNGRPSSQMLNERSQSLLDPASDENMIYYPAPVPVMLNLPKRLSKLPPSTQRDKRRSEMLSDLSADARKSAAWLPDSSETREEHPISIEGEPLNGPESKRRTIATLPPQLRASMFFDYPAAPQDIQVKEDSAVATLDSILDASAFAPVSAFTDHPIVGQAGADIYSQAPGASRSERDSDTNKLRKRNSRGDLLDDTKKRNSLMSIGTYFGRRKSSGQQLEQDFEDRDLETVDVNGESTLLRQSTEHADDRGDDYIEAQEDSNDVTPGIEEQSQPFEGQPTTLLAELQLRKLQQKLRNRAAATAFPDGMHSTHLQLDAVAQVQKNARKQKHTKLAWEEPATDDARLENGDDEDVPLGMLYPGQRVQNHISDEDRPLGLIARRQLEDNEPLSYRRARLRGEHSSLRNQSFVQQDRFHSQQPNQVNQDAESDEDEEHPGETLGQRIRRIKATQIPTQPRPVSNDFASEMMSQLGGLSPNEQPQQAESMALKQNIPKALKTEEETLGQRRKRLQAEATVKSRNVSGESNGVQAENPSVSKRHSMADVLQAHPAASAGARSISNELKFAPAPKTRNTAWAMQVNRQASLGQIDMAKGAAVHVNGADGGHAPHPMIAGRQREASGDVGRRKEEMIDRWRQSVMY